MHQKRKNQSNEKNIKESETLNKNSNISRQDTDYFNARYPRLEQASSKVQK